jgi:hypothetical protein
MREKHCDDDVGRKVCLRLGKYGWESTAHRAKIRRMSAKIGGVACLPSDVMR